MKRRQLKSSLMLSAGYNPDNQVLEIEFISGEVYQYLQVPEYLFNGLLRAQSHGQYFNLHIREQFEFKK